MMRRFHELRRHEEGQALVLACISMLVLALLVLATVSLTHHVAEKVRLQNAADAAAYTTAGYQARALNFMAYTNRAMVVHYASQMNMLATISYLMFCVLFYTAMQKIFSLIPYVGQVFYYIFQVLIMIIKVVLYVLDMVLASILFPLIDGLSYGMSLVQWGVSNAMLLAAGTGANAQVSRYNPAYRVSPLANIVLGLDAARRWDNVVSTNPNPFNRPSSAKDRMDRAIMTEIANSARHPWTAYGGKNGSSISLPGGLPRRANIGIGPVSIGKYAATEWGSLATSSGATGGNPITNWFNNITQPTEEISSRDWLSFKLSIFGFKLEFTMGAKLTADRRFGSHKIDTGSIDVDCPFIGAICRRLLRPFLQPITQALSQALSSARIHADGTSFPRAHHFHFGQVPYARFRPHSDSREHFNQPPVLLLVTQPRTDLLARGRPYNERFGMRFGNLSSSNSALRREYQRAGNYDPTTASKRGWRDSVDFRVSNDAPLPLLEPGFHAVSAALTYYHRPGDWREPPNLFNPFWGAKLMPVTDFPSIGNTPILRDLINGQLLVH